MEDAHDSGAEFAGVSRRFSWRALAVTLLIITAFVLVVVAWVGISSASGAAGGCGGG